jgi:hypothetical protein
MADTMHHSGDPALSDPSAVRTSQAELEETEERRCHPVESDAVHHRGRGSLPDGPPQKGRDR